MTSAPIGTNDEFALIPSTMANPLLRPFHLATISLVFLALVPHTTAATTSTSISLPPRASVLPTGARDDAPSSATGQLLRALAFSDRLHAPPSQHSDGGSSEPRRLLVAPAVAWVQKDQAAPAPSPQAVAPLRTRPAHHARAAARARYTHYGAALADLHFVCQPPLCFADSDHNLYAELYGPHTGSRWHDSVYCIVRTIEGTRPILPFSWRAYIYSGGDVCHVEIRYMSNDDRLYGFDCPAWTCERHFTTSADEALAWTISAISTPCGGSTSSAVAASSPRNAIALLPLLAIPFLPPPLAAAVALSSLASLVLATDLSEEEHIKVNHATCTVYKYVNATSAIERARPFAGLRVVCPRPLCIDADADSDYDERTLWGAYAQRSHGRRDDPLRVYCTVHSLEGAASPSIFFPWRNTWRTHLPVPVADIDAVAASGDHVCYVELAHMDYREGYYIRCPATSDGYAHMSCMEFPEEPVAAAVWEDRLTYRDTVGRKCERYKFGAAGQFWGYDYNADL